MIRVVSWICLTGIAVSVSALMLIINVMGGFGQAIKERLLSKEAHLLLHFEENPFEPSDSLKFDQSPRADPEEGLFFLRKKSDFRGKSGRKSAQGPRAGPVQPSQAKVQSLFLDKGAVELPAVFAVLTQQQREGIKEALVFETQDLILKLPDGKFQGVLAKGYSQNQWDKKAWGAGGIPEPAVSRHSAPFLPAFSKPVLLSYELSLQAGIAPGDELILAPIAGLLLPPSLPPPVKTVKAYAVLSEISDSKEGGVPFLYYPQGMIDFGDFSRIRYGAGIKLYKPDQASLYKKLFSQYKPQTWMERNSTLFFALKLEKFVMALFLALALLISCLGIASALFLLVSQKSRDLALLQAVGLSHRETVRVFTGVGLYLSLIGISLGAVVGLGGTAFLKHNTAINFLPEIYQDRTLPAVFSPWGSVMILGGALLLAWISCYVPARQISRRRVAGLLQSARFCP